MSRKRSLLLLQVLSFLLVTLLGIATGSLTQAPRFYYVGELSRSG